MSLALTSVEITGMVRDIVLITFFVLSSVVLIVAAVLGLKLYRRANRVISKADNTMTKVQSMVASVQSTSSTVKTAANAVNLGMQAGSFARTAASAVSNAMFGGGNGAKDSKDRNGKSLSSPSGKETASKG
jgi:hypothetical protein